MNRCIAALLFCLVLRTPALAHLLPTQRATLNFIGSDVFTVIALPVEVFPELDDNGDQRVSLSEFNAHRESLSEFIRATVSLECSDNSYGLLDLMLSPDVGHTTDTDRPTARHGGGDPGIDQLTVLGRFALADVPPTQLTLRIELLAAMPRDQQLRVTAQRPADGWRREISLTSGSTRVALDPPH